MTPSTDRSTDSLHRVPSPTPTYVRTYRQTDKQPTQLEIDRVEASNAHARVNSQSLAYLKSCDGCGRQIFMAICRDGRWRPFETDRQRVPMPFAWAWRKHIGMEETETVCGHLIHYCADFHDRAFRFADNTVARTEEDW